MLHYTPIRSHDEGEGDFLVFDKKERLREQTD